MIYSGNDKTGLGEQLEQIDSTTLTELQQRRKLEAFRAASLGSLYYLRGFLDDGDIGVNETVSHAQDTLLIVAAGSWHVEKVAYLLASGARVNDQNTEGRSALIEAARNGSASVIGTLLTSGARVDLIDKKGRTALMHAAYSGSPEAVELLLEQGADPNGVSHCGCAVLDYAMQGKMNFEEFLKQEEERIANGIGDPEYIDFLQSCDGPNHDSVMRMLKKCRKPLKRAA